MRKEGYQLNFPTIALPKFIAEECYSTAAFTIVSRLLLFFTCSEPRKKCMQCTQMATKGKTERGSLRGVE